MFRRPLVVRRRAPLLRGALVGGAGFMMGRAATRAADRDSAQDAAIAELNQQQSEPQYQQPQYQQPMYVPPPRPANDLTDRLDRLAGLHSDGVLTDEEFAAAKARLLGS
ncbi:SHOCT domain-containing protein [Paractinoplanes maris]|uniref:SHOCT domain-containing protein n=1 Tax=Paractinoplanes maris TaxID=1734446 RepID=UPI002020E45D|nr:SHOCT domain-containing protein [Actinoplanes maris]